MATISGSPPPRVTSAQPAQASAPATSTKAASTGPVDSFAPATATTSAAATAQTGAPGKSAFDAGVAVLDKIGNEDANTIKSLLNKPYLESSEVKTLNTTLNHLAQNLPDGVSEDDLKKVGDAVGYKVLDKGISDFILEMARQSAQRKKTDE